jgi:hypothetical protein
MDSVTNGIKKLKKLGFNPALIGKQTHLIKCGFRQNLSVSIWTDYYRESVHWNVVKMMLEFLR